MTRFIVSALLASAIAIPAHAALKTGDKAPDFKAKASLAGKTIDFSLKDALKKGPVVVYFYPSAYTGGCNMEAHAFAEDKDKFDAAHTTIIGVSGNSIETLNAFSADPQYCAGKFPVASDVDGSIAKSFDLGAMDAKPLIQSRNMKDSRGQDIDATIFIDRTTFVITKDHTVAATFTSQRGGDQQPIKPDEHSGKSLAFVQEMQAAKH